MIFIYICFYIEESMVYKLLDNFTSDEEVKVQWLKPKLMISNLLSFAHFASWSPTLRLIYNKGISNTALMYENRDIFQWNDTSGANTESYHVRKNLMGSLDVGAHGIILFIWSFQFLRNMTNSGQGRVIILHVYERLWGIRSPSYESSGQTQVLGRCASWSRLARGKKQQGQRSGTFMT